MSNGILNSCLGGLGIADGRPPPLEATTCTLKFPYVHIGKTYVLPLGITYFRVFFNKSPIVMITVMVIYSLI